jgi:hypothetical protein
MPEASVNSVARGCGQKYFIRLLAPIWRQNRTWRTSQLMIKHKVLDIVPLAGVHQQLGVNFDFEGLSLKERQKRLGQTTTTCCQ